MNTERRSWYDRLKHDPVPPLLESGDEAVRYFTRRDLIAEQTAPVTTAWESSGARRLLAGQLEDGSWKHPGKQPEVYPPYHYYLVEAFKRSRLLVLRYKLARRHPGLARAAEFLFSCQAPEGDIRGFIGNQYATYYTGAVLALLIRAGYEDDDRVRKGLQWLLEMRQDDGGWTIEIATRGLDARAMNRLTSEYAEPLAPDFSRPFSHNWTNMVLQAFAEHPGYRLSPEAHAAGELLKSCFFQKDRYTSYQASRYWVRFTHWWPNLLMALDSLQKLGFAAGDPDINRGLRWFIDNQREDGLWDVENDGKVRRSSRKTQLDREWLTLDICRMLKVYEA